MVNPTSGCDFDIKSISKAFSASRGNNDILLREYCDAYTEIAKFLTFFGKAFYFVNRDVEEKITILREHTKSDPNSYKSVKSMIKYESSVQGTAASARADGCRTLLRLHRALLFVIDLMYSVCAAPIETTMQTIVKQTYKNDLSEYHPWVIRQAVKAAVYALPKREQMVDHIVSCQPASSCLKTREDCKTAMLGETLPDMRLVYEDVQKMLKEHNMLHLP
ncbi:unnamed protein product [Calicophoron daubneyi]|uniref:Glycolipid transfer protein domain-containing protein n=1 Tax=Calicophoron daubneyi TaxID=300641 RepID=A0AAV2TNK5_CALDB